MKKLIMRPAAISPGNKVEFHVDSTNAGNRLDQWLATELGADSSRSQIQKWINNGDISTAVGTLSAARKVRVGEIYQIIIPPPILPDLTPVDLGLQIEYEDNDLALIIKPPGISVHPGPNDSRQTLINGLLFLWQKLPDIGDDFRPGIVHRLDRLTEGLMLVAKNEKSHRHLSEQFKRHEVYKEYLAWLLAVPQESTGTIDLPVERHPADRLKMRIATSGRGRAAITHYKIDKIVKGRNRSYARAVINIETGRTHQIRLHLSNCGTPVVGDPLYSRSANEFKHSGMLLLAKKIRFTHPRNGRKMEFDIDLPGRFLEFERLCEKM